MKETYKSNIVCLDYLWWGVSIGGKHYTGKIQIDNKTIELEKKLSLKEAKQYAEREGRDWLIHERITNKFDSFEELKRAAVKWCDNNMGEHWLLQKHDPNNPWTPYACKGYFESRFEDLLKLSILWDEYAKKNLDYPDEIYEEYYRLIKPPFENL